MTSAATGASGNATRVTGDGDLEIDVKVVPRASKSRIGPRLGDRIKVQLTAPPVDGEANAALILLVGKLLGLPQKSVTILRGLTGRQKTVRLVVADRQRALSLQQQLDQLIEPSTET